MSWLDWLEQRPAWPYYIVSAMVWAILSRAIYLIFRHSWTTSTIDTLQMNMFLSQLDRVSTGYSGAFQ